MILLTQERQETRLDLRKEIKRQLSVYREVKDERGRPFLEEWVRDITRRESLIYAAVAKDKAKIMERIKEGMIPIVMPGRTAQMRCWGAVLRHLKPIWVEDGTKLSMYDGNLEQAYNNDRTKKMTSEGFFKNIPDRPYLVWTRPTQEPDPETLDKLFDEQRALYATMVADDTRGLYDSTDLIPTEYSALQAVFTAQIQTQFYERVGKESKPNRIRPLDFFQDEGSHYEGTATRFLSAGRFSSSNVPSACFESSVSQAVFRVHGMWANSHVGFRPAARS